ncbi:unnamed protein product, partial [Amoebophrya sp. A120]
GRSARSPEPGPRVGPWLPGPRPRAGADNLPAVAYCDSATWKPVQCDGDGFGRARTRPKASPAPRLAPGKPCAAAALWPILYRRPSPRARASADQRRPGKLQRPAPESATQTRGGRSGPGMCQTSGTQRAPGPHVRGRHPPTRRGGRR